MHKVDACGCDTPACALVVRRTNLGKVVYPPQWLPGPLSRYRIFWSIIRHAEHNPGLPY